ncbi:MAG: DUF418 domain-containing protein [Bacteroidota bacterium]
MATPLLQPTTSAERIQALDFLRGFALLGILIVNIQSFAMPGAAYLNPTAFGDFEGLNQWVWMFTHIFGDQKFMTIFSILYGAGILLVTQKAEQRTGKSAGLHYRRTFWLLVIGLIHAHLIWHGDILVPYALCALFVFLFRKAKPTTLLIVGIIFMAVHTLIYVFFGMTLSQWPPEAAAEVKQIWIPTERAMQAEVAALTGSLSDQIGRVSSEATVMQTFVFFILMLWRAGGLMLVGMALYKWGVLTAKRSGAFYKKGMLVGWLIGFPLVIYGVYKNFDAGWTFEYSMYLGSQFNYWGSLFVSFGYICGIMLIATSQVLPWLRDRLAAVGQMALTNYIAQSVICVFIFFGIGFGLFGQIERAGQFIIFLSIWALQIVYSRPWLNKYRFGPLEWVWRSLTYWQKQPFRK